jgi:hypothetical protein
MVKYIDINHPFCWFGTTGSMTVAVSLVIESHLIMPLSGHALLLVPSVRPCDDESRGGVETMKSSLPWSFSERAWYVYTRYH